MFNSDMELFIKNKVEEVVMQAINDLGVKAIMREKIVEAGITKDDVKQMISDCVDSYVRSVDIGHMVRRQVENLVQDVVQKHVKEMFEVGGYDYRPNSVMRKTIEDEVRKSLYDNFNFSVKIEPIKE